MYSNKAFKLTEFALEAMIYEVSCFPSFGLVSPISNGSHKDMNFFTFIDSSSCLYRYFLEMAHIGGSNLPLSEIFSKVRKIGQNAEKAMFEKTKGVNTHKGMIFVLGLGITCASYCISHNKKFSEISSLIKSMTKGIVEKELKTLNNKKNLTHGEKIFLKYGITGVRGEAEDGFSAIFQHALDIYDSSAYLGRNTQLTKTLLFIMSYCEDTTILHRHDYNVLLDLQKKSKQILDLYGIEEKKRCNLINDLNIFNETNNISPGGCADLLSLTVFFSKVKETLY